MTRPGTTRPTEGQSMRRRAAAATGRKIEHFFMGRLVAENGEIKPLREALNTVSAAQVLLPGGAADIPTPDGVVRSF